MALQLVAPNSERRGFIQRYHDSIFAGHLGISRTVCRLLDRVYWPGLCEDVRSYIASCSVCLAQKSPCPHRAPMGHVSVGHRFGPGGYGHSGHVSHYEQEASVCPGYGGLFFKVDGGLSASELNGIGCS